METQPASEISLD